MSCDDSVSTTSETMSYGEYDDLTSVDYLMIRSWIENPNVNPYTQRNIAFRGVTWYKIHEKYVDEIQKINMYAQCPCGYVRPGFDPEIPSSLICPVCIEMQTPAPPLIKLSVHGVERKMKSPKVMPKRKVKNNDSTYVSPVKEAKSGSSKKYKLRQSTETS